MNILDKYIIKKFLAAFFFSVVILVSVICVIDFTEKNDDFIQHNLSMSKIIFGYYIYLFPYFANLLSPSPAAETPDRPRPWAFYRRACARCPAGIPAANWRSGYR